MFTMFYSKNKGILFILIFFVVFFSAFIILPKVFHTTEKFFEKRARGTIPVNLSSSEQARLEKEVQDLLHTFSANPPPQGQSRADAYRNLGTRYELLGKLGDALDIYEKGSIEAPTDTKLLIPQARVSAQMGDMAHAEELLKKVIALQPLVATNYTEAASFYLTYHSDGQAARGVYLEGLMKTNNDSNLMREFAGFLERIGEGYEAYLYWDALQKKFPADAGIQARVAELRNRYRDLINKEKVKAVK